MTRSTSSPKVLAGGRIRLWCELAALYFALPAALTALRATVAPRLPVIPVLWLVALPAALWLGADGFPKRELYGRVGDLRHLPRILLAAAVSALPLAALLHAIVPEALLSLPRNHPGLWMLVMVCYPILSVFPQGIIYRALFYRRYGGLFRSTQARRLVAALCFSFSHIFFLNEWALALTFIGGLIFSHTYERTGSVFVSNAAHAVFGDLVFTLGYGVFLYHGTLAMLS